MKTKGLKKKLVLNKKTIAHLRNLEMTSLKGGTGGTIVSVVDTFCNVATCFLYKTCRIDCPPLLTMEFETCNCP